MRCAHSSRSNTSSIQLIPVTAIGILVANKAANPTAIVGTSIMATFTAATCAVLMAKFLEKLPAFRLPPVTAARLRVLVPAASSNPGGATSNQCEGSAHRGGRTATADVVGQVVLGAYGLFFLWLFLRIAFPWMPGYGTR